MSKDTGILRGRTRTKFKPFKTSPGPTHASSACAFVYMSILSVMPWTRWDWCGYLLGLDLFPGVPGFLTLLFLLHPASSSLGKSWNCCLSILRVRLATRRPPLLSQAFSYVVTHWMLTEPCCVPGPRHRYTVNTEAGHLTSGTFHSSGGDSKTSKQVKK